jgi:hypothetical protein
MQKSGNVKDILGKIGGFVILAGIVFGLFVIVTVPFEMYKKAQAETWPVRQAIITKSFISHQSGAAGKHGRPSYWKAEICGTYSDSGDFFCVDRIRYGGFRFGEGKQAAQMTIEKYPVGMQVDVYYDPDDPEETVLEAHSPWTEMHALLGLGIGFLLLPAVLWLLRERIEPHRYGRK